MVRTAESTALRGRRNWHDEPGVWMREEGRGEDRRPQRRRSGGDVHDGGIRKEEGHAAPSDTLLPTFFADVFFCVCTKSALGGSDFRLQSCRPSGP